VPLKLRKLLDFRAAAESRFWPQTAGKETRQSLPLSRLPGLWLES